MAKRSPSAPKRLARSSRHRLDLGAIKTPSEEIVSREPFIGMFNAEKNLRDGKFVVKLALVYTRNTLRSVCPRCIEMLRRSIKDGREDWESFRKGLIRDTMEWPGDPCRQFNEAHHG